MLKIVNQTVKPALEKLGYNTEEIERIIAHIDLTDKNSGPHTTPPPEPAATA